MKFFLCVLLLLTIVVANNAKAIPFKKCGKPLYVPRYVSIEPYPPKAGGDLTVILKGPGKVTTPGGSFSYKVFANVKIGFLSIDQWLQVDSGTDDICKYTDCPIEPGYVSVRYKRKLPPIMTKGKYKIEIKAKNAKDAELACVEIIINLSKSDEKGEWTIDDIPMLLDPYPAEV